MFMVPFPKIDKLTGCAVEIENYFESRNKDFMRKPID